MRVARVFRRRHVRRRIADEPFVAKPAGHLLLNVVLRRRRRRRRSRRRISSNARSLIRYSLSDACAVRLDRRLVPHRGESLDEIARRHHLDARLPDELDRAGVDARDVGNRAVRRVFHRHPPQPRDQPCEARLRVARGRHTARSFPEGGRACAARWRGRGPRGSPAGGNQVVPAPRGQMTPLTCDRRHLGGDRVESAKIVEQPAVDAVSRQRRLDGRDVNRRRRDSRGHGSSIALGHPRLSAVRAPGA